jgi:hypothetical protein
LLQEYLLFVISKTIEPTLVAKQSYLIQEHCYQAYNSLKQTHCYKAKLFHTRIIAISHKTLKTKLIATRPSYSIQEPLVLAIKLLKADSLQQGQVIQYKKHCYQP